MTENRAVQNRYEFVLFFDVVNGNPNGDPDAGNLPRLDPETNQGLVSDVALKRKVRNYVAMARSETPGHEIYMTEGALLNNQHKKAWAAVLPTVTKEADQGKLPKDQAKARELTRWMCANFWDIRTFGAVMTTGVNAGQVRGPVQLSFARSVEAVLPLEISLTRSSVTNERDADKERTMGRKHIVPYGLYRAHGYVSAPLASHPVKGTGFSDDDLELLWEALCNMFDHDRSAARGEMATRKLVIFRHASALGNAHAQDLFERVKVVRAHDGVEAEIGDGVRDWPVARSWADYRVSVDAKNVPAGIEIIER
jgi:CRISPR-associated protein Csd2